MSYTRVGTDFTAINAFIADWHREGGTSALDRALAAIVESGQPIEAFYAPRGASGETAIGFTIDAALALRMFYAPTTDERLTLLSTALAEQNDANDTPISPFDADGNAIRLLNVISRLSPTIIGRATSEHQIQIRLHAENNGTSNGGDVRWNGSDAFDGRRVSLRTDHSTSAHRRRAPRAAATSTASVARPDRPISRGVSIARGGSTGSLFEPRTRRLTALADRMEDIAARVPDSADVSVRAARIAGTLEGGAPDIRAGRTAGRELTLFEIETAERWVERLDEELRSLGV